MDFAKEVAELRHWFASPRFAGIKRIHSAREVVEQRGTIRPDYAVARERRRGVLRAAAPALRPEEVHHHLRPLLARPGGGDEEDGDRGHLSRRLGHLRQGLRARGPGARPRQLPAEPGARRGGADRPRPAHRRQEPVPHSRADDRGAAQGHARGGLPALHHRRRRHRPRRRRARPQPRSGASSRWACRATTSRTRSRA